MSAPAAKLRFGVVGLTSDHVWDMGDGLARLPEVEVVSAADGHVELRAQAESRWGFERTYETHEQLLDSAYVPGTPAVQGREGYAPAP